MSLWCKIWNWFLNLFGDVVQAVADAITVLGDAIMPVMEKLGAVAGDVISSVGSGIGNFFGSVLSSPMVLIGIVAYFVLKSDKTKDDNSHPPDTRPTSATTYPMGDANVN